MKETQLRIQKYKAMLPRARERVIAALMIFVFSIAMLTVSTFSWITLSVAPEVTGATTTIAANGNLEIALARDVYTEYDENGNVVSVTALEPLESGVGDSLLSLAERNLTWGNIVNLSDSSYALDKIVLRPASLNTTALATSPLYTVKYGTNGRVVSYDSAFAYTQYNSTLDVFEASTYKGIKAISSVKETEVSYSSPLQPIYIDLQDSINQKLDEANTKLLALKDNSQYMNAISGLLATYMNGYLNENDDNELCTPSDIEGFYALMSEMYNKIMTPMGEAYMDMYQIYQLSVYTKVIEGNIIYDDDLKEYGNLDEFCDNVVNDMRALNAALVESGKTPIITDNDLSTISNVSTSVTYTKSGETNTTTETFKGDDNFNSLLPYIKDRNQLEADMLNLQSYLGRTDVTWGNIKNIVNYLVDIDTCTLDGDNIGDIISNLDVNTAIDLLGKVGAGKASQNSVVVEQGVIERLDKMLYNGVSAFKVDVITVRIKNSALQHAASKISSTISSMVGILGDPVIIEVNLATDAVSDLKKQDKTIGSSRADYIEASSRINLAAYTSRLTAQDTYGLSIDFWLRTNSPVTNLILEGSVDYIDDPFKATIILNGTTYENVQIYLADIVKTVKTEPLESANAEETDGTTDGEGTDNNVTETRTLDQEVYKLDDDVWRYYKNNEPVASETTKEIENEDGSKSSVTTIITVTSEEIKTVKKSVGYSGANRIWTKEELKEYPDYNEQYSTSQGSGSCYTFYADPSEATQILEILKAFKVVFLDEDSNILATAELRSDLCYSEMGKYIVPLVLNDSAADTGLVDKNGDIIRAVTTLEKNEPKLITALVYLDGTLVSNDKMLSSADIDGQLNIQFGNAILDNAVMDEDVVNDEIRISGKVTDAINTSLVNPTYNYAGENSAFNTVVTLTVEGDAPQSIKANFVRRISSTQGARQETITFTQSTADPKIWTANVTFKSPGEYILRSVIADGINRDLVKENESDEVKVTVTGFAITSFISGANKQSEVYMTANSSVSEVFNLTMATSDYKPSTVRAVFENEEHNLVTIYFSPTNTEKTSWQGTATFTLPGKYTLEHVILDGEHYNLPNNVVYTREIYTGLKAQVWLNKTDVFSSTEALQETAKSYIYKFQGTEHEFFIMMKIYDGAGNEMNGLEDVNLYYTGGTRGIDALLEWDASTGYYTNYYTNAEFIIETPGNYRFSKVTIGSGTSKNTINVAQSATTITVLQSEPYEFAGIVTEIPALNLAIDTLNSTATTISLQFNNAASAEVFGKFSKTAPDVNGNPQVETSIIQAATSTVWIDSDNSITTATFTLPFEDGNWKLEEVKFTGVYDGSGYYFPGEDDAEIAVDDVNSFINASGDVYLTLDATALAESYKADASATTLPTTKIVRTVNADVKTPTGTLKAADGSEKGAFMEERTASTYVTLTDFEGNAISSYGVTVNASVVYNRTKSSSAEHGGYTFDDSTESGYRVDLTLSDDGKTYSGSTSLRIAGIYRPEVTYTIDGATTVVGGDAFYIKSITPSVAITAISPTGTQQAFNGYSTSSNGCGGTTYTPITVSYTAGITNNNMTANVCYTVGEANALGSYNLNQPSVTITLSGIGNGKKAVLSFSDANGKDALIYESSGESTISQYSWTKDAGLKMFIGTYSNNNVQQSTRVVAGTIMATKLVLTYDANGDGAEETYTVTLSTPITINNPY